MMRVCQSRCHCPTASRAIRFEAITQGLACFELLQCVRDVCFLDDCVTFKNAPSSPAANFHDDAFGDSGPTQVAGSGAAKIMEQQTGHTGSLRRLRPGIPKIPDELAV